MAVARWAGQRNDGPLGLRRGLPYSSRFCLATADELGSFGQKTNGSWGGAANEPDLIA